MPFLLTAQLEMLRSVRYRKTLAGQSSNTHLKKMFVASVAFLTISDDVALLSLVTTCYILANLGLMVN